VTGVDNIKNKPSKASEIVLSFLRVLLKSTSKQKIQWLRKSINMNHSECLESIPLLSLAHEQLRNSCDNIENEIEGQVVESNRQQFLVSSSLLNEVENDLNKVNDVNGELNVLQGLIFIFCRLICSLIPTDDFLTTIVQAVLINILED
jgi:hypothetical protein